MIVDRAHKISLQHIYLSQIIESARDCRDYPTRNIVEKPGVLKEIYVNNGRTIKQFRDIDP
ncbi:hypothetical protein BST24_16590 [Mycobacteroides franklinii]|nr:hypothetical protein BST24_16590 [Mycobacteroides franklinii]